MGRLSNGAINASRRTIAQILHALPDNIFFTGGGSEADNMAIFGIARAHAHKGKHMVSVATEHHAVLEPLDALKKEGWEISYVKVDDMGRIDPKDVMSAIRPDTVLVSIMYANNEIGTIAPIADIGREILKYRKENNTPYPYFHSDACQAIGYLDLDVVNLHVYLMALNGSKAYGPKGVGALYVRRGVALKPLIYGGGQERRMRSGTENVPAIVGLAKAFELAELNKVAEGERVRKLSSDLLTRLQTVIPKIKLNGPEIGPDRLPNNLNVTIMDIEGEALLLYLDEYGIMCSTGSACTSTSLEPSHVLSALGLPYEYAHGSLRFTFGHCNTEADVDYLMQVLPGIVEILREISPVNMGKVQHAKYK